MTSYYKPYKVRSEGEQQGRLGVSVLFEREERRA